MHYKICNPNHGIKNNDIDLKTQVYQMNHSDLNIISYEMYDRKGCALCGIKNGLFPNFLTRIQRKEGFGREITYYTKQFYTKLGEIYRSQK